MTTSPPGLLSTDTHPPSRRGHLGRIVRYLAALLFTLVAATFVVPDLLFGIDGRSPFAQLAAFRPWLLAGTAALLALLLIGVVFARRLWPFAAGLAVVLVAGGALVLPRVLADPLPTGGTPLTVLTFNTFEGAADVGALADLIRAERPDVVSVVEAGDDYRSRLAPLVEPLGYRLTTSVEPGWSDVQGVTTVVAAGLGEVQARVGTETSSFRYLELTGGGLGDLRVVAFHSVAPVPGSVPQWRSDLRLLAQWCAGPTPAIVAGDFNATLDHSPLRRAMTGCEDAADQRGQGLIPTWSPTPGTRPLGPQIDHVLVTGGIVAETFSVGDIPGSDHRPILTRLRLPT